MNRFSGMVIFSSAYLVCLVAILCCMHIKFDAREIHRDQLISPEFDAAGTEPSKPIQYVLMNPLKPDYQLDLVKSKREPNILIATLPTDEAIAVQSIVPASRKISGSQAELLLAKQLDGNLALPMTTEPVMVEDAKLEFPQIVPANGQKEGYWAKGDLVDQNVVDQSIDDNPFSLASSRSVISKSVGAKAGSSESSMTIAESLKRTPGSKNGAIRLLIPEPVAPHVAIANDAALIEIRNELGYLRHIGLDLDSVDELDDGLNEVATNGSIDAGMCEALLYRVLDRAQTLPSVKFDEDNRLIESIRSRVIEQINVWLDQLNGLEPQEAQPEMNEKDLQKLKTAFQLLLKSRMF